MVKTLTGKEISATILEQLGGNKFITMTGSKNFIYDNDKTYLTMTLKKNQSKANTLTITLEDNDTYTVEFSKCTAPRMNKKTFEFTEGKKTTINQIELVYGDILQEIFTSETGFDTTL